MEKDLFHQAQRAKSRDQPYTSGRLALAVIFDTEIGGLVFVAAVDSFTDFINVTIPKTFATVSIRRLEDRSLRGIFSRC